MASTTSTLPPDVLETLREKSREDLYVFAKGVLGYKDLSPTVHLPLCRLLQDNTSRDKLIVLPRGWFKTTICSVAYPLWLSIRDSNVRILLVQNTFTNALAKLRAIQGHVEGNEVFRSLFPEVLPDASCVWRADSLCLKRAQTSPESTFEAAGIKTQIVSRHYDLIIEDDTVAPDLNELGEDNMVPTKDDIDQAIGFHRLTLPLLVNPSKSQMLVVGTRWFEKDLISWVKDNERSYRVYERACRETNGRPDPEGEPTFPERFSEEALEGIEAKMGHYLYSCLYLNLPLRSSTMPFQPEWVRYYETPPQDLLCYTTVDIAGNPDDVKGSDTDFSTVLTCGKSVTTGEVFVLDIFHERCTPGRLIEEIFAHQLRYSSVIVAVEKVACQSMLLYWVRERMAKTGQYFNLEGITHANRAKSLRIMGLQPVFQNGLIKIRTHHTVLKSEILSFPLGAHDDVLDALAMQKDLWVLTGSTRESTKEDEFAPFSLEEAEENIRSRGKRREGRIMDSFSAVGMGFGGVFN